MSSRGALRQSVLEKSLPIEPAVFVSPGTVDNSPRIYRRDCSATWRCSPAGTTEPPTRILQSLTGRPDSSGSTPTDQSVDYFSDVPPGTKSQLHTRLSDRRRQKPGRPHRSGAPVGSYLRSGHCRRVPAAGKLRVGRTCRVRRPNHVTPGRRYPLFSARLAGIT